MQKISITYSLKQEDYEQLSQFAKENNSSLYRVSEQLILLSLKRMKQQAENDKKENSES